RHIVCADEPLFERLNIYRPQTTRRNDAVTRVSDSFFGVNNLLAVRRPGRMIGRASIRESPDRLARSSHDKDSAPVALRAESYVRPVGRKSRLGVIPGETFRQVLRVEAAHALHEDVPVTAAIARINNGVA